MWLKIMTVAGLRIFLNVSNGDSEPFIQSLTSTTSCVRHERSSKMRVVREVPVVKETHNWVKLRVPNGEVLTKKQGVCDLIRLGVLKMLGQNRGHANYKKLPKTKSDHRPKSLIPSSGRNLDEVMEDASNMKVMEDAVHTTPDKQEEPPTEEPPVLSERRKALFEPLEPTMNINGRRPLAESLLPPPDFDSTSYPKGWLIGKKRKLVNVDVVESMRRIAVQEMNRKDREINGLNEQLDEDARCLEHLQVQLLQERSKRTDVERENGMLQDQISMLMNMIQDNDSMGEEGPDDP